MMPANLVVWAIYGAVSVSVATGVGVATGVIPPDLLERGRKLFNLEEPEKPEQLAKLPEAAAPAQPAVKPLPKPIEEAKPVEPEPPEPVAEIAEPVKPTFDILRLEKDGSIVVAGRAEPNAIIDLLGPDGSILGTAESGPGGDFVIIPDDNLKPGTYSLLLRSTEKDGRQVVSAEAGVIAIPETESGDLLAMVTKEGEASRIIVKPEELKPEEPVAVEPQEEPAAAEPVEQPAEEEIAAVPEAEPEEPEPQVVAQTTVRVEAVEIESGQIFVAGSVPAGSLVRIYIDNQSLGTARGTSDDRFLLQKPYDLQPGQHSVRADVVDASGAVIARAEVPLFHQPEAPRVAALETPKVEPATDAAPEVTLLPPEDESEQAVPVDAIFTGRSIIIRPGDTLWQISRRTYGQGLRYTTIYGANKTQIRDPNRIYIGQIFKLPTAEAENQSVQ